MSIRRAIYPGTFDPITNGHLDVIERAIVLFDEIIVAVARNSAKTPMFSEEERLDMIRESLAGYPTVSVDLLTGLTVDYAIAKDSRAIIRGLRAVTDFEYEFQIALMNRKLAPSVSTVFLMPHERYTYLSSSIIREVARHQQDISEFVPPAVSRRLKARFNTGDEKTTP